MACGISEGNGGTDVELEIHQRAIETIWILDLQGRVVAGESEAFLRETISALAQSGTVNIILNCAKVTQIDEDGLGCMVACSAGLRKAGGALKLLNLSSDHLDLLVRARLDVELEVFTSEIDAVNSFFPERSVQRFDLLEYAKRQREQRFARSCA
jgi:anti-sigma B factor antagonist